MQQIATISAAAAAAFLVAIISSAIPARSEGLPEKPATVAEILKMPEPVSGLTGIYGELSAAGNFLRNGNRDAVGSVGLGWDGKVSDVIRLGLFGRADFGDVTSGELGGKAGVYINPSMVAYGMAFWRWPDWAALDLNQFYLGAGLETSVGNGPLSLFLEGAHAVAESGNRFQVDDTTIRVGGRVRIK